MSANVGARRALPYFATEGLLLAHRVGGNCGIGADLEILARWSHRSDYHDRSWFEANPERYSHRLMGVISIDMVKPAQNASARAARAHGPEKAV
jgi:hypothetical protein